MPDWYYVPLFDDVDYDWVEVRRYPSGVICERFRRLGDGDRAAAIVISLAADRGARVSDGPRAVK